METIAGAEKAANAIFADTKNIKNFVSAMEGIAKNFEEKAKDFKSNKSAAGHLTEMAEACRKLSADVVKHVETAAAEVEDAKNELSKDKNVLVIREKAEEVDKLVKDWDKVYATRMRQLDEMAKELGLLTEEMDARLEGKVDQPAKDLQGDFERIRDDAQKTQDEMLGKKAYAVLKVVKEVRGLIKTVKNDKEFIKDVVVPFEKQANKFLEQRELLNVVSSNILGDAGVSFSLLKDGLKDELAVMKEVEKFAEIFYDDSSPNSVAKTQEQVDEIKELAKKLGELLKSPPVDPETVRLLQQQINDLIVKLDTAVVALNGALKTSSRLTRGRFEKHPMIGNGLRRMTDDVKKVERDGETAKKLYAKFDEILKRLLK